MATREILQNGTTANDGTGDTLRDASDKINTNFRNLFAILGDSAAATTALTISPSGDIVFDGGTFDTTLTATTATGGNKTITLPNSTGTVVLQNTTDTLTNKTLVNVIADNIHDSNDAPIITFNGYTGSVNRLEVTNGDSSTGISLSVVGDSGDVDIKICPLNSGKIIIGDSRVVQNVQTLTTTGSVASIDRATTLLNKGSAPFAVTLPDGINVGDQKKFVNINTQTATITPTNFAGFTSFTIAQNSACMLIWSGSNWHLLQDTGVTTS